MLEILTFLADNFRGGGRKHTHTQQDLRTVIYIMRIRADTDENTPSRTLGFHIGICVV